MPPKSAVTFAGLSLAPKSELHVTVIGRKRYAELSSKVSLGEIVHRCLSTSPTFWVLRPESQFSLLWDQDWDEDGPNGGCGRGRASIVQWASLAMAAQFFDCVSAQAGLCIEPPPFHITLWTAGDPRGIAVESEARRRLLEQETLDPAVLPEL